MKHYTQKELEHGGDSEEEQKRLRIIFEDLKQKALNKQILLEREKEFLCTSINHSVIESDGNPEDFDFCEDYIFRSLYLTYYGQNENGPFYKPYKTSIIEVNENEKKKDVLKLTKIAKEWEAIVDVTNHKDQLLQEISSEIRKEELKKLEKQFPKLLRKFKRKNEEFLRKKKKLILHSKFIYLMVKTLFENFKPDDFQISFSGKIIEITYFSLVHIVNRHYAETIKDNPQKTYHYKNFYPKILHTELKKILSEIDKSNLINLDNTESFLFTYENIMYEIWIQKKLKQIKGQKGNVEYFRLQSFYPVYDKDKLKDINENYAETVINSKTSVFIKN